MTRLRSAVAMAFGIALLSAGGPVHAQGTKEIKGVLERVDLAGNRVVVRETHGRKYAMPMSVGPETKIETPAGAAQLAALQQGDAVTVSYAPGPQGQMAREIVVTKPASSH